MGRKSNKIWVWSDVYEFPKTLYNSTKEVKESIRAFCENNKISINLSSLKYDFTKYMKRTNLDEAHQGFICTYDNVIINIDNEEWVCINTLKYKVYSQKTTTINEYDFSNVNNNYKVSNFGRFTNGITIDEHDDIRVSDAKKDFCGHKHIGLQYLLAAAFVPNPNGYPHVEVYKDSVKVDKFFGRYTSSNGPKRFDAKRDIIWVQYNCQKKDKERTELSTNYLIQYIDELVVHNIPSIIEESTSSNTPYLDDYDSTQDKLYDNDKLFNDSLLENEKWENIPDYSNYQISSYGRVKHITGKGENIISPWLSNNGYYYVKLGSNKNKPLSVHKLVANAFINKYDNLDENITVNHIDGIKTNNIYNNLEWISYSEQQLDINKRNPTKILPSKRHPVIAYRNDDQLIDHIKKQINIGRVILGITINNNEIIIDESVYKKILQFDLIYNIKDDTTIGAEQYFANLGFSHSKINYDNIVYGYKWSPIEVEGINDEKWVQISELQDFKREYTKYVGYQISNYGRIKTPKNEIRDTRLFKTLNDGSVKTCILKDNIRIHDLVLLAFNGQRPSKKHLAHHKDSIKTNNHYLNLEWKTMSEKCKKSDN